jgi:PhnB protein
MPENVTVDARTMRGVIPYVAMDGRAGAAADFYRRAFAARDLGRVPGADDPSRLMHCQVEINGGALMMTDMHAPDAPVERPQGFHLQLVVEDGALWWDRAVAAGCTVLMPFQRMFWGDRWGLLADPFGLRWAVNEPAALQPASPGPAGR